MFLSALKSLGLQAVFILILLVTLGGLVWLVDDRASALKLLDLAIRRMQGLWVWTFGWGLASLIQSEGRNFANDLRSVLDPGPTVAVFVGQLERGTSHRAALWWTTPISLGGFVLTILYGVPVEGLGRWLVILGVTSIYYVGGFLLFHFVSVIRSFTVLYRRMDDVEFRRVASPLHLENALNYLSITTTLGVLGIYAGFRGTLTAGFLFENEVLRPFLLTPLILFLPGTLFYNFHPRYVLRRLVQHRVFAAMSRLGTADGDDAPGLVVEIKELGLTNAQILPFIDYKSLPSYVISILFVISLAYHNDPAVKSFLSYLLGLE